MIIFISQNNSINTEVIFRLLKRKRDKVKNTLTERHKDIKAFFYHGDYLLNLPSINRSNWQENLEKAKIICKVINIVIFCKDEYSSDNKIIFDIYKFCKEKKYIFIVFDKYSCIEYGNLDFTIINKFNELEKYIRNNLYIREKPSAKYILIGLTGVGKSSLINQIAMNNVFEVSETRHTTKEVLPLRININDKIVDIYDTFGLEYKTRGRLYALKNLIKNSTRVFIVTDIYTYNQKININMFNILYKLKSNISIIVNKYDLIKDSSNEKQISKYFIEKIKDANINYSSSKILSMSIMNLMYRYMINQVPNVNCRKLTKEIKVYFPDIAYIRQNSAITNIISLVIQTNKNNNASFNIKKIRSRIIKIIQINDFYIDMQFYKGSDKQYVYQG